jgi:hypothetical protein
MAYPPIAPSTEAIVQYKANLKDNFLLPKHNAINSASGGIGKKEDSMNDSINKATTP